MGKWFHRASEIENLRAELKRQAYLIDKLRGQLRSAGLIEESSTSADAVEESLARTGQTIEAVKPLFGQSSHPSVQDLHMPISFQLLKIHIPQ